MPRRVLAREGGRPTSSTQRNFTDPDGHLIQTGGSYLQRYKCQLVVDSDHQVIVATDVSKMPPGIKHLENMLQRNAASTGALPVVMTMDGATRAETTPPASCRKGSQHRQRAEAGQEPLRPSQHGQVSPKQEGLRIYDKRKAVVEPVNRLIKEARGLS